MFSDQKDAARVMNYWDKERMYVAPWSRSPSPQHEYFEAYGRWGKLVEQESAFIDKAVRGQAAPSGSSPSVL